LLPWFPVRGAGSQPTELEGTGTCSAHVGAAVGAGTHPAQHDPPSAPPRLWERWAGFKAGLPRGADTGWDPVPADSLSRSPALYHHPLSCSRSPALYRHLLSCSRSPALYRHPLSCSRSPALYHRPPLYSGPTTSQRHFRAGELSAGRCSLPLALVQATW